MRFIVCSSVRRQRKSRTSRSVCSDTHPALLGGAGCGQPSSCARTLARPGACSRAILQELYIGPACVRNGLTKRELRSHVRHRDTDDAPPNKQYRPRQGAEMSSANVTRMKKVYDPHGVVDDDLRHIQDLVFVRDLLAAHGATPAELKEYDAVIDGVRRQLARDAKSDATQFPTAA